MSIEVEGYNNYAGERLVRVCMDRARANVLTVEQATVLRDQLDAAIRDEVEIDFEVMFEDEDGPNKCPVHSSGRTGRCNYCEDSE